MNRTHSQTPADSLRWFREARFGMFIHYGLYSLLGRHEWVLAHERIPFAEYRQLMGRFKPRPGCVREWIALAQTTGMRYACLTTRHCEGFALFDTKASDFNVRNTPAHRDLVAEFVEACRQARLRVALYYSVGNWGDASYCAGPKKDPRGWKRFVEVVHTQLRELMTRYGRIDYLFYDACPPPQTWGAAELNREIRRLQPQILISSRCGLEEDVLSAEDHTIGDPGKMWETCMTTNRSWGYNGGDPDWKSPREVALHLMTCCHNGGNYLLNIGPKADGSIPAPAAKMLRQVGDWVRRNAAAIYGTDPHPFDYADQKLSTGRGRRVFLPLQYYLGPETTIAGIGTRVKTVRLLASGRRIRFRQDGNRVHLTGLPRRIPDRLLPIVTFDLAGRPKGVPNPVHPSTTKYDFK